MNNQPWSTWILAVRSGDGTATEEFWQRYALPLLRLADRNLQQRLRRRVDPEDVVQSAFRTVLRRIQDGQFVLDDDEQLWRLMCAVTLNKSRKIVRRHGQQKRALDQEVYFDGDLAGDGQMVASDTPTPDEAAILVDLLENVVSNSRDEEEQAVLLMKLDEHSNDEIAERLRCSERTVRRILDRLRGRLVRLLDS